MAKECCSTENKPIENKHKHDGHNHDHSHENSDQSTFQMFLPALISFLILIFGIAFDYWLKPIWFKEEIRLIFYLVAYFPVGFPVLKEAFLSIKKGDFFSEFFKNLKRKKKQILI